MPRAAAVTLLIASLLAGAAQAQRLGGLGQGANATVSIHQSSGRHGGFRTEFSPGIGLSSSAPFFRRNTYFPGHRYFARRAHFGSFRSGFLGPNGFGTVFIPDLYAYDEPLLYEEPIGEPAAQEMPRAVVPQRKEPQSQVTPTAGASPQLIELPGSAYSDAAKPLRPTVFLLRNGERLESRRFVLTASMLSISIDRHQRAIPIEMIDIDSTLSANRERGIDLRIPADQHEISLSF